ncbi:hypothetical protein Hanom_Chr17g01545821 [Helianthus anomalus]
MITKKNLEEEICEPKTPNSTHMSGEVCGSHDRGEEMLICGDESYLVGCGWAYIMIVLIHHLNLHLRRIVLC